MSCAHGSGSYPPDFKPSPGIPKRALPVERAHDLEPPSSHSGSGANDQLDPVLLHAVTKARG
jgi:hypothetical protein